MPPFALCSFDFICCQFAFHHLDDKAGMLHAVLRMLRPDGRFVMRNLCPQQSAGWLYYRYFPEARRIDLRDFWPPNAIIETMKTAGFVSVASAYDHLRFEQDLSTWLETVRRRDICSQLQAISNSAYAAGVKRLESDVADPHMPRRWQDQLCLVRFGGAAPGAPAAHPI